MHLHSASSGRQGRNQQSYPTSTVKTGERHSLSSPLLWYVANRRCVFQRRARYCRRYYRDVGEVTGRRMLATGTRRGEARRVSYKLDRKVRKICVLRAENLPVSERGIPPSIRIRVRAKSAITRRGRIAKPPRNSPHARFPLALT